jgi:hypothetical protein
MCAECKCSPKDCSGAVLKCKKCTKQTCCCNSIHENNIIFKFTSVILLIQNIKRMYVAALGIEILCILSAEIGENFGMYVFGINLHGVVLSYVMGYTLAGFSTFMAILGRHDFSSKPTAKTATSGCCSFLEENSNKGFVFSLAETFLNFRKGVTQLVNNYNHPQMNGILKSSIVMLITAESACILTAETVDLLLYQYSLFLAIPLALTVGTFTLAAVESFKKIRSISKGDVDCQCSDYNPSPSFVPFSSFKRK